LVDALIYQQGGQPDEISVMDDDLLTIILEEINRPEDGKLLPFAPVLTNVIKQYLQA
jgi:hypothetical protein